MDKKGAEIKSVLLTGVILAAVFALSAPALAADEKVTITPFVGWVFGGKVNTWDGELKLKETQDYGVNVDIPF